MTRAQLIDTGKKKGYVLYSDLDELLPEDYEGGPELDDLLSALESANVEILGCNGYKGRQGAGNKPVQRRSWWARRAIIRATR